MIKDNEPSELPPTGRPRRRVQELEAELDDRDETIQLLNEALSRVLDELSNGRTLAA